MAADISPIEKFNQKWIGGPPPKTREFVITSVKKTDSNWWKEAIIKHLQTGGKFEDEKLGALWKLYLEEVHHVEYEKEFDKGILHKEIIKSPEDEKRELNNYLISYFPGWLEERGVKKSKEHKPKNKTQKVVKPESTKPIEMAVSANPNPNRLKRFVSEADQVKIRTFSETWGSGKVIRVGIKVKKEGDTDIITTMGLAAMRNGKEELVYLSRELLTNFSDKILPYRNKNQGPATGIRFYYNEKDFQFIRPDTKPEVAKQILSRVKINGKGLLADPGNPDQFEVVFTRQN